MKTNWFSKHSMDILYGCCIAGMVGGTVLAVQATPKALVAKQAAEQEKGSKLTVCETIKTCYKYYIPTAGVIAASTTGLVAIAVKKNEEISKLALASIAAEKAITEYKDKVVEVIGEKKAKEIDTKVAEEKVAAKPIPAAIITDGSQTVIFDEWSGRYVNATIDQVRNGFANAFINMMRYGPDEDYYITVNDVYSAIGIPSIPAGDHMGWNAADDIAAEFFMPEFHSVLKDERIPVVSFTFNVPPRVKPEYARV